MQDYCIIDQDAAWQLFGSNNVAGMTVNIGGTPHIVVGVVERPEGRLVEAAGLDSTLVYVSYQTLNKYGSCNGINHYEIVMPDPVTGFAENLIREGLGTSEKETEVLENTSRYSFLSRLKLIPGFGTRSMNGKAIIYPYWENVARGYEDILAVITLFELLFLLYAVVLALVFFGIWWKHKGWTLRGVWLYVKDKAERMAEKLRAKRLAKKGNSDYLNGECEGKPQRKPKKTQRVNRRQKQENKQKPDRKRKPGKKKKPNRSGEVIGVGEPEAAAETNRMEETEETERDKEREEKNS